LAAASVSGREMTVQHRPAPRRRFQFRLWTLMIVVTLLAVMCGYVGWQMKIARAWH
jgi:hypothetical protein